MDDADFGRTRDAIVYAKGWTMGAAADFVRREMTPAQRASLRELFDAADRSVRAVVDTAIREAASAQAAVDVAPPINPPEA